MSAQSLKLSKDTLAILRNMSNINNSMAFRKGQTLSSISESQTVFAVANIGEEIPRDFCIYDLSQLLGTMALPALAEGDIIMSEDVEFMVLKGSGGVKAKYFFTDDEFVTAPSTAPQMPTPDAEVVLTDEVMESFAKACATLHLTTVKIRNKGGKIQLIGTSDGGVSSNDYVVTLRDSKDGESEYSFTLKQENFGKLIGGTYDANISNDGIAQFINRDIDITYYIGIETT